MEDVGPSHTGPADAGKARPARAAGEASTSAAPPAAAAAAAAAAAPRPSPRPAPPPRRARSPPRSPRSALAAGLEASLVMAQAALAVRRGALDTLLSEVAALRAENDTLAAAIVDPSFSALRQRLQYLEAELEEERAARQGVERELADTAEATYEMWDAFRDWMGSESRAGTSLYSRDSSPDNDDPTATPGWRSPTPARGETPVSLASPVPAWRGVGAGVGIGGGGVPPLASPRLVDAMARLGAAAAEGGLPRLSPRGGGGGGGADAARASPRGEGDAAAVERRVKALAGRLQPHKDAWRGRPDTDASRDRRQAAGDAADAAGAGAGA